MTRTQIQLPDTLYERAKLIAKEHEISLAELVRRGLEHMVRLYPVNDPDSEWTLPNPVGLGEFVAPAEDWRELASVAEPSQVGAE